MFWPCETRTSTCRNFATISSGLYRFLVITVLLDVKDIPQVGPLQWGRIMPATRRSDVSEKRFEKRFFVMGITSLAQPPRYTDTSTRGRSPMARLVHAARWFFSRDKRRCSAVEFSAFGL